MKPQHKPNFLHKSLIAVLAVLLTLVWIVAFQEVKAAVNPTPDTITTLDVQCANGRRASGKCAPSEALEEPSNLPLATWANNFTYAGAFKVPTTLSSGTFAYSGAQIGQSITSGNMYMTLTETGTNRGIAEIQIPTLNTSTDINALSIATEVQGKIDIFATPDGNPQQNDRVAGIYGYGTNIFYTLIQYYDAPANNTLFFGRVDGASDFTTATLNNQFGVGGDYKAAGWISEVPAEWQASLGYDHIMGNASNTAILGRASVGPSAYGFNISNAVAMVDPVPNEAFQSYPYDYAGDKQLQYQVNNTFNLSNTTLTNDVWTFISKAGYGFIIPGTRTYAVVGSSGGHASGVLYKGTQTDGNVCAGNCPSDPNDWGFHYWLFDVNDWLLVKNGSKQPYEVVPYEYGEYTLPFKNHASAVVSEIGQMVLGGMFDATNSLLYLTVRDNFKPGSYDSFPLVYAFSVGGL